MADACSTNGSERAQKRQSVETVKSFDDIDVEAARIKEVKRTTQSAEKGAGKYLIPLVENEMTSFNLSPCDWSTIPFGFDTSGNFERPSFLTGGTAESTKQEGLHIRMSVAGPQVDFLQRLDLAFAVEYTKIDETSKWSELLGKSLFQEALVKVFVPLSGHHLCPIKVVADGKVVKGEGWEFLKGHLLSHSNFRRAEVKVVAKVMRIWNMNDKAGMSLIATQLVVRPLVKPMEADAFPDSDLLA
jgi:hypothetical protein